MKQTLLKLQQVIAAVMIGCLAGAGGCATPVDIKFEHSGEIPPQAVQDARRIAADPVAFLRASGQRCNQLAAYAVEFYRQERRGLLRELKPEEHMGVKYRAEPFSVKMDMRDPDSDLAETAYVAGQNKNRLRCRWRRSLLPGFAPPVKDYDPNLAVASGRSRNPITDFGVARLMQKVLSTMDLTIEQGLPPQVSYLGTTDSDKGNRPVHHLQLLYDPQTNLPRLKVDLQFHVDSLLPAASYLWLADGKLDAQYHYDSFDLNAEFTDADFQIARPAKGKGS